MTDHFGASAPIAARFRHALRGLVRAQARRDRALAAVHGLTPAGAHALEVLAERGPLPLRALAAALCVDDSTASRTVGLLEDRGWVVLELDGPVEEIERGLEWVAAKGVRVDPVPGDIVEG